MNITLPAPLRQAFVNRAVRDLPITQRVTLRPETASEFGGLMARGLIAREIAELADCSEAKVYKSVKAFYNEAEWLEITAQQHKARAFIRREVYRDTFWQHRHSLDPKLISQDNGLLSKWNGDVKDLLRQAMYAERQGFLTPFRN